MTFPEAIFLFLLIMSVLVCAGQIKRAADCLERMERKIRTVLIE